MAEDDGEELEEGKNRGKQVNGHHTRSDQKERMHA